MPTFPPLPAPVQKTLEEAADALAYLLATDARTSYITWVLGEPGMGDPDALPFGYLYPQTQNVKWYTANGRGSGGLAAGLDDWQIPFVIIVAVEEHRFEKPVTASPAPSSAFANLGIAMPFLEQPGWRDQMEADQLVLDVLRTNIVVGGYLATTTVSEDKHFLLNLNNSLYRASRISVNAQQRRTRGT